ncbi:hypothetical protein [Paramagnetospirillum magnetotacticum]|uniref:hypothetical protein n=1 Tax=Paramagnetospirillum magnetotacticum TaxID=188 RepID=UPI00126A7408|nr:hypothetical protein [Paramagnetospirillum magnetotacticum]
MVALADFIFSQFSWFGLIRHTGLRIHNPVYHHTLRSNLCGLDRWGGRPYPICTNSLGFKDGSARIVAQAPIRPRLLFIGDSFTEAIGMPWKDSFVGLYSSRLENSEVLNAAVASYAPSIYYTKVRHLLEQGLTFDHVIVFVDPSDIQDETHYHLSSGNNIIDDRDDIETDFELLIGQFIDNNFIAMANISDLLNAIRNPPTIQPIFANTRASWTFTDWNDLSPHYPSMGVASAIEKAKANMDQLYELLKSKNIRISVGVYPWPDQLNSDHVDSVHVKIWREWCTNKCSHFIDTFPDFFSYKASHPQTWYSDLYIGGDVHFSELGNSVIAEHLRRIGPFEVDRPFQ